jgi:tellurite resistance protein TerB
MGFLDNLKAGARQSSEALKTQVGKFKSKDFAEASMAASALIAAADGSIDSSERSKVAAFISSNDTLSVFNVADLRASFEKYCDKLTSDYDFGKIECIQVIGKLRTKPDAGRAVVQIACIIGKADGDFDNDEKTAVKEICQALGIDASEFVKTL